MSSEKIVQVLLLSDDKFNVEMGPLLWAALIEAESFYNASVSTHRKFERYYAAPSVPKLNTFGTTFRGLGRRLFGDSGMRESLELLSADQSISNSAVDYADASGRYAKTYNRDKLADAVRKLVKSNDAFLEIVTDRELTPPRDWRYIIWGDIDQGSVISTAPLDPHYWRDRDTDRVSSIKHRARTAILAVTGEALGMQRCQNPTCFLFEFVESVLALDLMTELGPEHSVPDLVGVTFEPFSDPGTIQRIVQPKFEKEGVQ